jgi:hypothetical protein
MNHRDAGVFQAYLNEQVRCDVQAAFLGRPSGSICYSALSARTGSNTPKNWWYLPGSLLRGSVSLFFLNAFSISFMLAMNTFTPPLGLLLGLRISAAM